MLTVLLWAAGIFAAGSARSSKYGTSIHTGKTLQELVDNGLRIAMIVGSSGKKYSPAYEVSAIAMSTTFFPVTEAEGIISTFGNDGFGRATDDLYVAFVGDPHLRLFQLAKCVGGESERILKIGSTVEYQPSSGAPFHIGSSLTKSWQKFNFVQNTALDNSWKYELAQAYRGNDWITIYKPKYSTINIATSAPSAPVTGGFFGTLFGGYSQPSAPPATDYGFYEPSAPTASYEPSATLKKLYDDGLYGSLVFAPTDEAAAWMPGEPFTLTAFAVPKDYYTVKRVLDKIDGISGLVPGIRFITIKGDTQGRLFELKKYGGDWVIDRVEDKGMEGAPFELEGRLKQGDLKHAYFAYNEFKFVPWYTAEKGYVKTAVFGTKTVPVSFVQGIYYDSVIDLFSMPVGSWS
ncbi:hypothetical protein SmJEL517_g02857 [Synchytrium microbalum]|uniref:FAS1 domain-containing protein n=1 Tax=Synchytrium microbalum TaxID=1806994 RepID=A0A507C0I3_9FUNG|nr:uncharacterized protein SmJEL517_g02857 [Synchytrium microbalum]TPX34587.1 hypothetical protein SmJEL517_g02857 [Synchytrium microbalum]